MKLTQTRKFPRNLVRNARRSFIYSKEAIQDERSSLQLINFEIYTNPRIWGFSKYLPKRRFQSIGRLENVEKDVLVLP